MVLLFNYSVLTAVSQSMYLTGSVVKNIYNLYMVKNDKNYS